MFHAPSSSWQAESPLKVLISRATYPSQPEPNYALNIEVAEYVNQKKANTYVGQCFCCFSTDVLVVQTAGRERLR